jgi:hypothetical protein
MRTTRKSGLPAQTFAVAFFVLTLAIFAVGQASTSRLYATGNFGTQLFSIDLASQSVTVVGSTGQVQEFSLAFDPRGHAYTLVNPLSQHGPARNP